jgi:pyridoxal phosphate enzyme (YggS family)
MNGNRIVANLRDVRARVEKRCLANGVDPAEITIVGVTKLIQAEMVVEAVKAGLTDLGENRVQEAAGKIPQIALRPRWHMIGHLQKNKVKKAVELFDVIQSVDSLDLARSISGRAVESGKTMDVCLQLNSSGEITKHGFDPGEICDAADKIKELPGLRLCGLMTIGPLTADQAQIEKSFSLTRELFGKLRGVIGDRFSVLSMGMSGDYELALDYGANMLRIGTSIFGPRPEK